jgi:hypothetical protein
MTTKSRRRRGRPVKIDADILQRVWVLVEILRLKIAEAEKSAKKISARRAIEYLAARGGITQLVGGLSNPPTKQELLATSARKHTSKCPGREDQPCDVTYTCSDARNLYNIYVRANKLTKNEHVYNAWRNMVADSIGQPRICPQMSLSRPRLVPLHISLEELVRRFALPMSLSEGRP